MPQEALFGFSSHGDAIVIFIVGIPIGLYRLGDNVLAPPSLYISLGNLLSQTPLLTQFFEAEGLLGVCFVLVCTLLELG